MSSTANDEVSVLYAAVDMSKKKKNISSVPGHIGATHDSTVVEDLASVVTKDASKDVSFLYAVVDKSKKKKSVSTAEVESDVTTDFGALYAEVHKTKSKETNPFSEAESNEGVVYSLADSVGESDSVKLKLPSPVAPYISKVVTKGDNQAPASFKFKVIIILLSISLAVMTFACFVVSVHTGREIARLKSLNSVLVSMQCMAINNEMTNVSYLILP